MNKKENHYCQGHDWQILDKRIVSVKETEVDSPEMQITMLFYCRQCLQLINTTRNIGIDIAEPWQK